MMLHANNFSLKYEYENLVVVVAAAVVVAVVICSLFLSDIIPQTTDCRASRQSDRQKRNISQNVLHKMQFYEDYLSHVLDFYMRF